MDLLKIEQVSLEFKKYTVINLIHETQWFSNGLHWYVNMLPSKPD